MDHIDLLIDTLELAGLRVAKINQRFDHTDLLLDDLKLWN